MRCSKFTFRPAVAAASAALLLAACGGGGGGGDAGDPGTPPPPVNPPGTVPTALESLQGFWAGPFDTGTTAQAIILRTGEVWMVVQSGSTVQSVGRAQAAINATGASASGGLTNLQSGATAPLALTATSVAPKTTLTGTVTTQTTRNLTWTYNSRYDTALPVANFAGRWTSTSDQQRFAVTWDFAAGGAITGTSTTGCTYTGNLAPLAQPVAVVTATLVETCAGAGTTLTGIATMNDARNRASFVLATQAGNQYTFAALQK